TIGAEGLVGINAFLGGVTSTSESMVQVPGATAVALPVGVFRSEAEQAGPFRECLQRYSQGLMGLMMQSAACLALHRVEARCCRWLLMAHDRVGCKAFQLSQEFLAMMLGSSRQTVNVVASALQKEGIISYAYGRVNVLDRGRLEQGACECYRTVEDLFARLELERRRPPALRHSVFCTSTGSSLGDGLTKTRYVARLANTVVHATVSRAIDQ